MKKPQNKQIYHWNYLSLYTMINSCILNWVPSKKTVATRLLSEGAMGGLLLLGLLHVAETAVNVCTEGGTFIDYYQLNCGECLQRRGNIRSLLLIKLR